VGFSTSGLGKHGEEKTGKPKDIGNTFNVRPPRLMFVG
jgi:hypothetical protein